MSLPKQARINAGYSLEGAAKKLNISGGYLSQIENGLRQISADRAREIAELYNKQTDEIFLPSRYSIREVNECTA
ncbi:helix-turn-helix domain-containing protein [Cytobacillus oceanisediminis]|uniref:helix-turn-helix domain-containing protein n=1 Tax=Cytobacillus oceanisediminis TaxID=665099 RepID=UPI0020794E76|nr:helix-turn-helix transcriptional regulator [Cytobacillus oceanisediminis]USK43759.1 helix-turn-helix domain-containing protein [Cytobacillus oceanisediminis]